MLGLTTKKKADERAIQLVTKSLTSFFDRLILPTNTAGLWSFDNNNRLNIEAYATIDDLYSIVGKLDDMCKSVGLYAYEVKDEKAFSKYSVINNKIRKSKNYTNKSISDLAELQYKAMEILGDNDPLQKILERPNTAESKDEFYSGLYIFPLLTGNCYTVITILGDAANKGLPYELYHLSPAHVGIVPSATLPRRIERYKYSLYNQQMTFEAEQVMHRKYFNPVFDYSGSELYGLSPLAAAAKTLSQIKDERDYAMRSLRNSGKHGTLVAEDADASNVEAMGQLKDDVLKELGASFKNGSNQNAGGLGLVGGGKWSYINFGISPADMQLVEQGKITFKKLCNVYGLSDRLFNNDSTGSEISIDKMLRDGFISVAIPQVAAVKDMFNISLSPKYNTDRNKRKKIVDYDISDVTQLQEDINSVITRYSNAPGFKPNDLREAQGYGRDLGEEGEIFLLKQGYAPLSDVAAPLDVTDPNALKGYNDYERG